MKTAILLAASGLLAACAQAATPPESRTPEQPQLLAWQQAVQQWEIDRRRWEHRNPGQPYPVPRPG